MVDVDVFTPGEFYHSDGTALRLFLAGSIENGKAVDWQKEAIKRLTDWGNDTNLEGTMHVFNPRNATWDANLPHDPTPGSPFWNQVMWELEMLNDANIILFNFCADTISPITLLEFGRFAENARITVQCPKEYFRYGNVAIVCNELLGVPVHQSFDDAMHDLIYNQIADWFES